MSGELDFWVKLGVETAKVFGGISHELTVGTLQSAMDLLDGPNGFRAGAEIIDLGGHLAADVIAYRFVKPKVVGLFNRLRG